MVTKSSAPKGFTPPSDVSDVPPFNGHNDHSFTLQAIMELQKTTGQLTEAITSLRASIEKNDQKYDKNEDKLSARLEKIEEKLSGVTHKIYAAGVIILIIISIGAFTINKTWDLISNNLTVGIKEH